MDNTNWYELWMQQSKVFFESADQHIKGIFDKEASFSPEEQLKHIQQWLETVKRQWQTSQNDDKQQAYQDYWKMMAKVYNDASELFIHRWTERVKENNPINSLNALYELWLTCCNEVYTKAMHSKMVQETYGECMNAALKFWKDAIPK